MPIDYRVAQDILEKAFGRAEESFLTGTGEIGSWPSESLDILFSSSTQAYREVLIGAVLVKLLDPIVNIRRPYVGQGTDSYNGRTLDEKIVNPFLQTKRIPSSKGPFLSVFRRSVPFVAETRQGLRDKIGYDHLLVLLDYVQSTTLEDAEAFLSQVLYRLVLLRESSIVQVNRIHRLSLEQYDELISRLLSSPSGGRFPVLCAVATFKMLNDFFGANWVIEFQGINVSDAASGVGGDITIRSDGQAILSVEVTERPIDVGRAASTFNTKIAPVSGKDYLFLLGSGAPSIEARRQAHQYFAQGHEMVFMPTKDWMLAILATVGSNGRIQFNQRLVELLVNDEVPAVLKARWNEVLNEVISL